MTLQSVADRPGIAAAIFGPLSDAGVNVDMIIQNIAEEGRTDMTFSCPTDQVMRAEKALNDAKDAGELNFADLIADTNVAKISAVGIGQAFTIGCCGQNVPTLSDEVLILRSSQPQKSKFLCLLIENTWNLPFNPCMMPLN